jgi:hypothetical protein
VPDTALAGKVRAQGGGFFPIFRPAPVSGVGSGILPRLVGEAHGEVILAGAGVGVLQLVATAAGEVEQPFPSDDEIMLLLLAA